MGEIHQILILYSRKIINQKYFIFNFLNIQNRFIQSNK